VYTKILFDHDFITIEAGAVVSEHAIVQGHLVTERGFRFGNTAIGERAVVGACVYLHAGEILGADSSMLPLTKSLRGLTNTGFRGIHYGFPSRQLPNDSGNHPLMAAVTTVSTPK